MLAFERLEPFGALHDEQMHGAICALTANINRNPKKTGVFSPGHFMAALGRAMKIDEPILLKDKRSMSELIASKVFGRKVAKRG